MNNEIAALMNNAEASYGWREKGRKRAFGLIVSVKLSANRVLSVKPLTMGEVAA